MSTHPHYDEKRRTRLLARGREIGRKLKEQLPRSQHESLSNEPYPVLSAPLVTLYASPSNLQQSEEAFALLAGSRTAFRVEKSADGTVFARFAGKDQLGLEGVRNLADTLLTARDILLAPGEDDDMAAELEKRRVPGLQERAAYELEEYLAAARGDLERILRGDEMTGTHPVS